MTAPNLSAYGVAMDEFLREIAQDDAVQFVARVGAGLLVLHESALIGLPAEGNTLSLRPEERPRLATQGFRVFTMRPKDRSSPFLSVGRTPTNDVVIPDGNMSRFHAFFRVDGDNITLQDTGSRNGSFVNEVQVPVRGQGDPVPVHSGDAVRFGTLSTTFLLPSQFREFAARLSPGNFDLPDGGTSLPPG